MRGIRFATLFFLFVVLAFSVHCSSGDDDDDAGASDDDGASDVPCDIEGADMAAVDAWISNENCSAIGLNITLDKLLVNPTYMVFEAKGQYAITNTNRYLIRGTGVGGDRCFSAMEGAGEYDVLAQTLECAASVSFDVVTSTSDDAQPFCSVTIQTNLDCTPPGDDDDDTTAGDDDTGGASACATAYTELYVDCEVVFYDVDDVEIELASVIAACEDGVADYAEGSDIFNCIDESTGDCDAIRDCLADLFAGTDDDDDSVGDDDDNDDDSSPIPGSIGGTVLDFLSDNPQPNATVEALNDVDGMPLDPAVVGTTDEDGYVLLELPAAYVAANDTVAIKVSKDGYKNTIQYGFPVGVTNETFLGISTTTLALMAGPLGIGIPADPAKGQVAGAVYWGDPTDETTIGCAEVSIDVASAGVFYLGGALGLPTHGRDITAPGDPQDGEGTNPEDGVFVGLNITPTDTGVVITADADGNEEIKIIPRVEADSVIMQNIYYAKVDYTTNPQGSWCTE